MMERHFFITAGLLFSIALFFAASVHAEPGVYPAVSKTAASAVVAPGGLQKRVRQIW